MSLLLDALKKAASDKEKGEANSAEQQASDSELNQSEKSEAGAPHSEVFDELSDHADEPEKEGLESLPSLDEEIELDLPEEFEELKDRSLEEELQEESKPEKEVVLELEAAEEILEQDVPTDQGQIEQEGQDTDELVNKAQENKMLEDKQSSTEQEVFLPPYSHNDARRILEVSQKRYRNNQRTMYYGMYIFSALLFFVASYLYYTAETLDNSQRPAFKPSFVRNNKLADNELKAIDNSKPPSIAAVSEESIQKNTVAKVAVKKEKIEVAKKPKKITIIKQNKPDPISELLHKAYQYYQSAQYQQADKIYQQVLTRDKRQRDALLGRAAIAVVDEQYTFAKKLYEQVLHYYPKDSIAKSALVDLTKKEISVANESQLNLLLRADPEAAHVHFSLGLVYAKQGRTKESQQAFFDAFSLEKKADYAFNLAVMLEKLGQSKVALTYYKKASRLSDDHVIHFDEKLVLNRIEQLEAAHE